MALQEIHFKKKKKKKKKNTHTHTHTHIHIYIKKKNHKLIKLYILPTFLL